MKVSNRLIAGLGVLMFSASALVHAAPPDQRGPDDNGQGQHQEQGHDQQGQRQQGGQPGNQGHDQGNGRGNAPQANNRGNDHGGGRPPQDFGDVRRTITEHREIIGRGQPLPPNIHVVKGRPMPHGYGRRLDDRSLQYLPRYDGYEWRRVGPDVVLIAIGSGIVYEILDGVLN